MGSPGSKNPYETPIVISIVSGLVLVLPSGATGRWHSNVTDDMIRTVGARYNDNGLLLEIHIPALLRLLHGQAVLGKIPPRAACQRGR